jgi:hypothetical protein
VEVVRAYADSMRVASTVLGQGGSPSEIDAGAAALRAGVSREDVRRVRRSREGGDVTTALIVLTDLVRRGVRGGDATDAVAAVGNSQGDDGLRALQREMAREGMPATPERLRATVQELRRRPEGSTELHQALDPRALPMASRTSAFAVSAWRPSSTASGSALLEGGLGVPLGRSGLAVSGAMRAGVDVADSMLATFRGTVSFSRLFGANVAGAGWFGMESRPVSLGGSSASRDTTQLSSRTDFRHRSASWIAGGSVARGIGRGVALGAMAEVTGDEMMHLALVTKYDHPEWSDTAIVVGMEQRWLPTQRFFLRTAVTAAIRSFTLQALLSQRVAFGSAPDTQAGRSLFAVSAEHRLAQRVSLFAQASSRDPVGMFGKAMPTESRLRIGARWREGRSLPPIGSLPAVRPSRGQFAVSIRQVTDSGNGTLRLTVEASQARVAWVEGDLTGWRPVALVRDAHGGFSGTFPAHGPIVRLRIRLDSGSWQVPPGVASDVDEFGEVVGMMVVAPQ